MFSATLGEIEFKEFLKVGMRNPVAINLKVKRKKTVDGDQTKTFMVPKTLENYYTTSATREDKIILLIAFLRRHPREKMMLFLNTCSSVDYYHKLFRELSILSGKSDSP